jgi:hypothetical protein
VIVANTRALVGSPLRGASVNAHTCEISAEGLTRAAIERFSDGTRLRRLREPPFASVIFAKSGLALRGALSAQA